MPMNDMLHFEPGGANRSNEPDLAVGLIRIRRPEFSGRMSEYTIALATTDVKRDSASWIDEAIDVVLKLL